MNKCDKLLFAKCFTITYLAISVIGSLVLTSLLFDDNYQNDVVTIVDEDGKVDVQFRNGLAALLIICGFVNLAGIFGIYKEVYCVGMFYFVIATLEAALCLLRAPFYGPAFLVAIFKICSAYVFWLFCSEVKKKQKAEKQRAMLNDMQSF